MEVSYFYFIFEEDLNDSLQQEYLTIMMEKKNSPAEVYLQDISMKINDKLVNLGIKDDAFFVSTEEQTAAISFVKNELIPFYHQGNFLGEILKIDHHYILNKAAKTKEILLIPVKGNIRIKDKIVGDNSGILLSDNIATNIQTDDEAVILLLSY